METFSALLAICAGNSPVTGELPSQKPVTPSFDVFFDLRLNERQSKQSWGWWFETPSHPLWRHSNVVICNWWNVKFALLKRLFTANILYWFQNKFCVYTFRIDNNVKCSNRVSVHE